MTKALILRTCKADMTGHGGFRWPTSGYVEAPDWDPTPDCGNGLHGFLWGEGDGSLANWSDDAWWLVVEVEAKAIVDLGGKVKFPRGEVIYAGYRDTATRVILERNPGAACTGCTKVTGDNGTATAGYRGTATAGDGGTATAGYRGTATAGDDGTATAGYRGTATVGYGGTATAGDYGTAAAGDYGTAAAGDGGEIRIRYCDGDRYRTAVGYVGEDGIKPDVPYRCTDDGEFVEVVR